MKFLNSQISRRLDEEEGRVRRPIETKAKGEPVYEFFANEYMTVKIRKDIDFSNARMVLAFKDSEQMPNMVSAVLIDHFQLPLIGSFHSKILNKGITHIKNGEIHNAIRIYGDSRIMLITTEIHFTSVHINFLRVICAVIVSLANKKGIKSIVVLASTSKDRSAEFLALKGKLPKSPSQEDEIQTVCGRKVKFWSTDADIKNLLLSEDHTLILNGWFEDFVSVLIDEMEWSGGKLPSRTVVSAKLRNANDGVGLGCVLRLVCQLVPGFEKVPTTHTSEKILEKTEMLKVNESYSRLYV